MDWLSAVTRPAVLAVVLLATFGCDPTTRKLSGTDCKPRKLVKMSACVGEDHSFQECSFFFRATGVPEKRWCEALATQESASDPSWRCDWNNPAAWQHVPCADYNIHGAARCFACRDSAAEAAKTYVYAYDASCAHGIEQVTCNVDAPQAGAKLGPATL